MSVGPRVGRLALSLLPLAQAWGGVALLHRVLQLRLQGWSMATTAAALLALAGTELLVWQRVERVHLGQGHARAVLVAHLVVWIGLTALWVEAPALATGTKEYLKSHLGSFFKFVYLFTYDHRPLLAVAALAFAWAYRALVARRGWLRLTVCLLAPLLLVLATSVIYYLLPGRTRGDVEQSGGQVVFSLAGRLDPGAWYASGIYDVAASPRGLLVDEAAGRFDAAYGSSAHCWRDATSYPSFFRISAADGSWRSHALSTVKGLVDDPAGRRIFAAGWNAERVYVLDRDTFDISRELDLSAWGQDWGLAYASPLELAHDPGRDALFIELELHGLVRYGLADGSVRRVDLADHPGVRAGTMSWGLRRDPGSGLLYVRLFGSDMALLEVDPDDLHVVRDVHLPGDAGGFVLDGARRAAYATAFFGDELWRLDLDTLQVRELGRVGINSRALLLDDERQLLYALGYDGDARVVDARTGRTVRTFFVGEKAADLALTETAVYAHSAVGIVRFPRVPAPDTPAPPPAGVRSPTGG